MKIHNLLFLFIFFALLACNESSKNQYEASVGLSNEKLVQQLYERFNAHDWEGMAALYAETAEYKDPEFGKGVVKMSRKELAEKYRELEMLIPDIKDEVVNIYPSGEKHVVVEFVSSGKAPDGSVFELPICTIFKIEGGVITQDFTYYDNSK